MKYSQLFSKTVKSISSDEQSINAQLLTKAGFITKEISGVYNFLPLGLKTLRKIENIVRSEMNKAGAQEILMPSMTGLESWKTTNRQSLDVLFHLQGRDESELVLNPTHEEVATPLLRKFAYSYKDLPQAIYQIQIKFRNEPRAKSGLLRGREFLMKDLYSFHAHAEDLETYYEKMKEVYFTVYQRIGLENLTVLTYASGGAFSKYSHEFQVLADVGEDTVHLCERCRVAVNKEIIADQPNCPVCGSHHLVEKQAIEAGNIFKLGTKFSGSFDFKYTDEQGQQQLVEMGCYGIGISRLMGILVEIFHDDRGIIWPKSVAPFSVHLISLPGAEFKAQHLYDQLIRAGIEVLWDDRSESAGSKFADADLIGLPVRLVVSIKTGDQIEWKNRTAATTELITPEEVMRRMTQ